MARFSLRSSALIGICSLVALAVALSAGGYVLAANGGSSNSGSSGTIEVNATAQLKGAPDTLALQLAVVTNGKSAAATLDTNNAEMHHLQSIFRAAGVAAVDLQTTGLTVGPTYSNNGKPNGYQTEDDLAVTLHNIARAGAVIDAAENAVGNDVQIDSIAFSLAKDSTLLSRARVLAMQQARAQAQSFARGADETLGSIVSITQNQSSPPLPFTPTFSANAGVAHAPVPIQAGTEQVSVNVDVVYRLLS